jgi:pseudaminic acid biosynthesis-associated methylase
MGFTRLTGIEIQRYAVEKAKRRLQDIDVIQGSGLEIPFRDGWFDLVYTSGVLIHVAPEHHARIAAEMARCSGRFIWGFEYFAETTTEVNYRGHQGFLWKADFPRIISSAAPGFHLVKKQLYPYITEGEKGNVDCMYLLEKA